MKEVFKVKVDDVLCDVQYNLGCLVLWWVFSTVDNTISIVEEYKLVLQKCMKYCGGKPQALLVLSAKCLCSPSLALNILHSIDGIPPQYLASSTVLMISPTVLFASSTVSMVPPHYWELSTVNLQTRKAMILIEVHYKRLNYYHISLLS